MHALWIFIFRPPMPSAPNVVTPVAIDAVVGGLDAFDAERRHGVDVGGGAQPGPLRPRLARDETDAEAAGAEEQLAALEHCGGLRGVGHRHRVDRCRRSAA